MINKACMELWERVVTKREKRTEPWSIVGSYMLFIESVYMTVIERHMRKCKRYVRETTATTHRRIVSR